MRHRDTGKHSRPPTREEWTIISDQFDRLVELDPHDQQMRLQRARLSVFVTGEVERLLMASRREGVLDRESVTAVHGAGDVPSLDSLPSGTMIDGFRIDRMIGRGGAGDVYLATRVKDRFAQTVALKLLRPDAIRRREAFDAERALVAGLDHPGIARLIDGGTAPDGRPYMALDFVEGDPITAWCRTAQADLAERLRLFLEVCDAVSYAHARLVVHNDLKPGNILIDRSGRARLLDFGVAKVIGEDGEDPGTAVPGMLTPGYAAPEQLAGRSTTTATDVYALGALLFELLVGRMPWKASQRFVPTVLRRLADDLPTPPSRAASAGSAHAVPPGKLAGDLDAIVIKAMQKLPEDRYATVDALAGDIRRYLRREPILARSHSTRYRAGRFVQRNRLPIALTAIAALGLVGGSAAIAWQAQRTAIERDVARDQAKRFEAANQALLVMFRDAGGGSRFDRISVAEMVDDTTRRMIESLPADSPDAAPMIAALADIYLITENNADAQALLEGAMKRGIGRGDPVDWARLKLKLGTLLAIQGRFALAEQLLDEADRVWRAHPERYLRESVESVGARAVLARLQGRPEAAIKLLADNMAAAAEVYAADDRDFAARVTSLAALYANTGKLGDAVRVLRDARGTMARPRQPPSSASLNTSRLEADLLLRSGKADAASAALTQVIALRRRFYGPSIALAVDLLYLARLQNVRGEPVAALAATTEAEPMAIEHFGSSSQPVVQIRISKVEALARLGRVSEARRVMALIDPVTPSLTGDSINALRYRRVAALLKGLAGDRQEALQQLAAIRARAATLGRSADAALLEITATERAIARAVPAR